MPCPGSTSARQRRTPATIPAPSPPSSSPRSRPRSGSAPSSSAAATYMSMKNFERAIAELARAVRLPGPETDAEALYARYFLSLAYEQTRQLDKAIEQWERIEQAKPGFEGVAAEAQAVRAAAHRRPGQGLHHRRPRRFSGAVPAGGPRDGAQRRRDGRDTQRLRGRSRPRPRARGATCARCRTWSGSCACPR